MSKSAADLISERIQILGDWRGKTLAKVRALIKEAVPNVVEEWKWRGVPVWYDNGIICTGETYKDYVKTTFAKGAALNDSKKLFNSSLEGNTRRAIDFREGEKLDEAAFKALVREAAALNASKARPTSTAKAKPAAKATATPAPSKTVKKSAKLTKSIVKPAPKSRRA